MQYGIKNIPQKTFLLFDVVPLLLEVAQYSRKVMVVLAITMVLVRLLATVKSRGSFHI